MQRTAPLRRRRTAPHRTPPPIPIPIRVAPPRALLLRKSGCSCGGGCPACKSLSVAPAHDPAELEADRVADQVMRMPEPPVGPGLTAISAHSGAAPVQRMCADCEVELNRKPADETIQRQEEDDELIQTKEAPGAGPALTASTHSAISGLRGGGAPLPAAERAFFEPRFGRDFSQVRVHTDARAAEAARAVNAKAFTLGDDIAFGAGQFQPNSGDGRRLLAHELTHTVQQRQGAVRVQRTVEVWPDVTAAADILDQFNSLCPTGNFILNGQRIESNCTSSSQSCDCLCDVTTDASRAYSIEVHIVAGTSTPETLHDGRTVPVPTPSMGPNTDVGTNPIIRVPSSTGSAFAFGAFQPDGTPFVADNWRILGHELCGHGRLRQSYPASQEKGDRRGHNVTIGTENAIAGEHGDPVRGEYNDPRQGESFHSPVGSARLVFRLRDGWHYEQVP